MFNLAAMFATARLDTVEYSSTYFQGSALACSYLEETLKEGCVKYSLEMAKRYALCVQDFTLSSQTLVTLNSVL